MSKKASSHDIRNKEPLDEWEGQTVLLRQEWKRLRDELQVLMQKVALEDSEESLALYELYGGSHMQSVSVGEENEIPLSSKEKKRLAKEKQQQKIAERDNRVWQAYFNLRNPIDSISAEELLFWQQEVRDLKKAHKKPYDPNYYRALELHLSWLKSESWEDFVRTPLMQKQPSGIVRDVRIDWDSGKDDRSNPWVHLNKLKPKRVVAILSKFCAPNKPLSDKAVNKWRMRWENLGYFTAEAEFIAEKYFKSRN